MAVEKIYQGSSIDLEITLTEIDATPINPNDADDVLVLFRYKDGKKGSLAKFAKTASGSALAWTAPDAAEGKLLCHIPASTTQEAYTTNVVVELKVKMGAEWTNVSLLDTEFIICSSNLADD